MHTTATDTAYERVVHPIEAARVLGARIEPGDDTDRHFALHINGQTLFINSESPIEFAVPKEA